MVWLVGNRGLFLVIYSKEHRSFLHQDGILCDGRHELATCATNLLLILQEVVELHFPHSVVLDGCKSIGNVVQNVSINDT
jgi:hypothetical protein